MGDPAGNSEVSLPEQRAPSLRKASENPARGRRLPTASHGGWGREEKTDQLT